MWGVLVEGETMRRKNKGAKILIKEAANLEYVKREELKKKTKKTKQDIPEYFTSAHGAQMTFPA